MELGPMGMAPWGAVQRPAVAPEQFCDFAAVSALLGELGVPPDFESDGPLRYTHRRTGEADMYFVANREDRLVEANCAFRVSGKAPELWNPHDGKIGPGEYTHVPGKGGVVTRVRVKLPPVHSVFLVAADTTATTKE